MKKLSLLFAAAGLAFGANAQQRALSATDLTKLSKVPVPEYTKIISNFTSTAANKGTGTVGGSNWYVPFDDIYNPLTTNAFYDPTTGDLANVTLTPIWFDSTVRQRFSTGLGTINFSSFAQVIDVVSNANLYDDPTIFPNTIDIRSVDSFVVDSITIRGAYVKQPLRSTNIVDTLIVSVGAANGYYFAPKAQYSWAATYIPNNDTLFAFAPTSVDSVNRALFSSSNTRAMWKIPLTDAMRDTSTSTGSVTVKPFTFAVPNGGVGIRANSRVGMTVTFKSGDTWTKNVDSVTKFHRFLPMSGFGAANTAMIYKYYDLGDKNGSSIMFSTDTSSYLPSVIIEGINTAAFNQEFHAMGVHVKCSTCWQVNVKNVATNIASVNAVPNPANNSVSIPVSMKESANVTVSLINTLGQTVKMQDLGNVNANQKATATFNTADLASGVYIYNVTANGQRTTGRLVVAH
ncbi:T9SS type A sorting domain-containing protein [Chitinophagaceae bacterium MMS25-I14]